eukprot:966687-Prymnesium_polylepis.1
MMRACAAGLRHAYGGSMAVYGFGALGWLCARGGVARGCGMHGSSTVTRAPRAARPPRALARSRQRAHRRELKPAALPRVHADERLGRAL